MKKGIKWIRVICFKHDGSFHRIWDKAGLIYEDKDKIVISNSKTLIREDNGRMWMAKEPSVSIFYKNRWFNVMGILRKGGVHYYCNMASPCVIENNIIKYIDYDLDLVKTVDNKIKILDEDEYKVNKEKYDYGEDIEKILEKELKLLRTYAVNNQFAFNDKKVIKTHEKFVNKLVGKKYGSKVTN